MEAFSRRRSLERLRRESYDVVVIGAGMTGAGVALDAAQRGLRVALIDCGDVAVGTSSKSSKMVHGGLRYLQQKEFRLVYENLRERQRLLNNAPHLVRVLPFLIPLFGKDGVVSKTVTKSYSAALRIYDLTGGWRIGRRYQRVTREEALAHLPTLKVDRLVAGFLYFDARGDDARVALCLAQSAAAQGADVATYVRATGFEHDANSRVCGVNCRDERSNETFTVTTKSVVNATGVWADDIFSMAERASSHRITPAKGVHVSVPSTRLPADVAAVFAVPGDRRSIFVVPFEEAPFTYLGTTDTTYEGALEDPLCEPDDVSYLLRAANASTSSNLTLDDVTGVWAGLRPLLAPEAGEQLKERTADLSRRHKVIASGDGVIHVTGGKWTTYRQMAEDAVDALAHDLGRRAKCKTANLRLYGAAPANTAPRDELGEHLYRRFGTYGEDVASLIRADASLGEFAISGLPYRRAEMIYSARNEMVETLEDLLTRRTRAHLQDARATLAAAEAVAQLVAPELGWDAERVAHEVAVYRELVEHEFRSAGLSVTKETT
jgi:glycerol-3-phosphate dehydrogenase